MRKQQQIPQELQQLITLIENQKLILAEVNLPDITAMPDYKQVLRVQDNNIVLSYQDGCLKINPKRILIHKVTGEELDLNLPVPLWEKTGTDMAALVDAEGERILVPTTYYETVNVEITPATYDEEGNILTEPVYEEQEQEVETKMEAVLVPVIKYLMLIISEKKYKEVFQMFTLQYIQDVLKDDMDYFSRLK